MNDAFKLCIRFHDYTQLGFKTSHPLSPPIPSSASSIKPGLLLNPVPVLLGSGGGGPSSPFFSNDGPLIAIERLGGGTTGGVAEVENRRSSAPIGDTGVPIKVAFLGFTGGAGRLEEAEDMERTEGDGDRDGLLMILLLPSTIFRRGGRGCGFNSASGGGSILRGAGREAIDEDLLVSGAFST